MLSDVDCAVIEVILRKYVNALNAVNGKGFPYEANIKASYVTAHVNMRMHASTHVPFFAFPFERYCNHFSPTNWGLLIIVTFTTMAAEHSIAHKVAG